MGIKSSGQCGQRACLNCQAKNKKLISISTQEKKDKHDGSSAHHESRAENSAFLKRSQTRCYGGRIDNMQKGNASKQHTNAVTNNERTGNCERESQVR